VRREAAWEETARARDGPGVPFFEDASSEFRGAPASWEAGDAATLDLCWNALGLENTEWWRGWKRAWKQ
jgi:hypothetical protein